MFLLNAFKLSHPSYGGSLHLSLRFFYSFWCNMMLLCGGLCLKNSNYFCFISHLATSCMYCVECPVQTTLRLTNGDYMEVSKECTSAVSPSVNIKKQCLGCWVTMPINAPPPRLPLIGSPPPPYKSMLMLMLSRPPRCHTHLHSLI